MTKSPTKSQIWRMRARELQRAAAAAADPLARDAYRRQAGRFLRRARRESIATRPVGAPRPRRSHALQHAAPFPALERKIRRLWPWVLLFGAAMIVVAMALSVAPG